MTSLKENILELAIEKTDHLFYRMADEECLGLDAEEYRSDLLEDIELGDDVELSENQWKDFVSSITGIDFELEMRYEMQEFFLGAWSYSYRAIAKLMTEKIRELKGIPTPIKPPGVHTFNLATLSRTSFVLFAHRVVNDLSKDGGPLAESSLFKKVIETMNAQHGTLLALAGIAPDSTELHCIVSDALNLYRNDITGFIVDHYER